MYLDKGGAVFDCLPSPITTTPPHPPPPHRPTDRTAAGCINALPEACPTLRWPFQLSARESGAVDADADEIDELLSLEETSENCSHCFPLLGILL